MRHSPLLNDLLRALQIAKDCDEQNLSTREGVRRAVDAEHALSRQRPNRRDVLKAAGAAALAAGLSTRRAEANPQGPAKLQVAIVGGGLGGLVCADQLTKAGIAATVYEGRSDRVGGRTWSNPDDFPGQVVEMGGEMLDGGAKTMLAYANALGLTVEDYLKEPGDTQYWFGGQLHSSAEVVDQWRAFVNNVQADLRNGTNAPTAFAFNATDQQLDTMDLSTYLDLRAPPSSLPLINALLKDAYVSEYGLECSQQSPLNLLQMIKANRTSKFNPYGFSNERYHIVEGNDQVAQRIAARLPGPVYQSMFLTSLSKNAKGKFVLGFRNGATATADAVVLAIPFSVLRGVTLDASLGLPPGKVNAIQKLGYGANGKTMIGFNGRPWAQFGSNGYLYSDLPNVQNTWESDWTRALTQTPPSSVLTEFYGGNRGIALETLGKSISPGLCSNCHGQGNPYDGGAFLEDIDLTIVSQQVDAILTDLDKVWPGVKAAASKNPDGTYVCARGHWWVKPFSLGCYTCYLPGQFTTVCGWEPVPVGNLFFAGEHCDSFYDWQGFMEGAAISGVNASAAIQAALKAGTLTPLG